MYSTSSSEKISMPNLKIDYKKAVARVDYKRAVAAITTGVFVIYKEFKETPRITDNAFLFIGKAFTDTMDITETGSIRMQSYCSFDYFSDDYVGSSLTF